MFSLLSFLIPFDYQTNEGLYNINIHSFAKKWIFGLVIANTTSSRAYTDIK